MTPAPVCYIPSGDPLTPFRPTALVKALVAFDPDVRAAVLAALDRGWRVSDGDRRCTWGDAERLATTPIAAHVIAVLVRDSWGYT